jgi:hypothetical protein
MREFRKIGMDAIEGWIAENKRNYVSTLCARRGERIQAARWLAAQHQSVIRDARIPKAGAERAERPWLPLVRVFCLMVAADVTERFKRRWSNAKRCTRSVDDTLSLLPHAEKLSAIEYQRGR